jgi:tetratricopeptide (TPR) repeat protein
MQSFRTSSIEKVSSARNWARDGFAAVKQGKLARAKTCFSNAARELPEDHRLTANLARTEFDQGNIDSAIGIMETAVANSGDPALHAEVGEMHLTAGRWLQANRHADLALEKDYRLSQAWILKGRLAAGKGDQQTALQHFHRAAGLDSKNEELQLLIARTYLAMGRPMQSLSATETLLGQHTIANQPDEAVLAKAEALSALKQTDAAMFVLETAAARPQCSKQIFFQLGQMQLQAGAPHKARATLNRGQEVHPTEPVFGQLLASISANSQQLRGEAEASHVATPHRVALAPTDLMNQIAK